MNYFEKVLDSISKHFSIYSIFKTGDFLENKNSALHEIRSDLYTIYKYENFYSYYM
jgi:hypothetical protein